MKIRHMFLTLLMVLGLCAGASAGEYLHSAPAVQGYDVVSYQTAKRPVRGNGHYTGELSC